MVVQYVSLWFSVSPFLSPYDTWAGRKWRDGTFGFSYISDGSPQSVESLVFNSCLFNSFNIVIAT